MAKNLFLKIRIISPYLSYRVKQLMTRKTAFIKTGSLCVILTLLSTHVFVTYKVPNKNTEVCQPTEIKYLSSIVAVGDMLLYCIIPSLIIIPSNILIVLTLIRSKSVTKLTNNDHKARQKLIRKVIPMLLVISTVFVVCTLPVNIFLIGKSPLILINLHFIDFER